jgi:hypothetical protein
MVPTDTVRAETAIRRFWRRSWRRLLFWIGLAWFTSLLLSGILALIAAHEMATHTRSIKSTLEFGSTDVEDEIRSLNLWARLFNISIQHPGIDVIKVVPVIQPMVESFQAVGDLAAAGVDALDHGLTPIIAEIYGGRLLNQDNSVNLASVRFIASNAQGLDDRIERLREHAQRLHTSVSMSSFLHRWSPFTSDLLRGIDLLRDGFSLAEDLPSLTGTTEKVIYLVALTTPAELRGIQGLIGNYALVSIDKGIVAVEEVGSNLDLVDPSILSPLVSPGYGDIYGSANLEWLNMNLSPFGNDAGAQIHDAWKRMGKEPLSGVLFLDTVALGQLASGSLEGITDAKGVPLNDATALSEYLTRGVYFEFPDDQIARKNSQTELAQRLLERFLSKPIPVTELAPELGRLIRDGRIVFWAPRLANGGGSLARSTSSFPSSGVVLAFNNVAGNKADSFLEPSFRIDRSRRLGPDLFETKIDIELHSSLPKNSSTFPDYVTRRLDNLGGPRAQPASVLTFELGLGSGVKIIKMRLDQAFLLPKTKQLARDVNLVRHTVVIEPGASVHLRLWIRTQGRPVEFLHNPLFDSWNARDYRQS